MILRAERSLNDGIHHGKMLFLDGIDVPFLAQKGASQGTGTTAGLQLSARDDTCENSAHVIGLGKERIELP